jgi:hypothetical protein
VVDDWNVIPNTGGMILTRNTKVLKKYLLHCHFVYHKSQGISNSKNSVAVVR